MDLCFEKNVICQQSLSNTFKTDQTYRNIYVQGKCRRGSENFKYQANLLSLNLRQFNHALSQDPSLH